MNNQELARLRMIVRDKWIMLNEEFPSWNTAHARVRWNKLCETLGITMLEGEGFDFEWNGQVLEEYVVIMDPVTKGSARGGDRRWLEIPKDTAMKILTLGMP